jgi:Na+/melibiose symporter-like transporter
VLYFWRVRCAEFGKALWARLLGLAACVGLLMLVVQMQNSPGQQSWAIYAWIALLCAVHSAILLLLVVEVRPLKEAAAAKGAAEPLNAV